jgi:hypothetical protein
MIAGGVIQRVIRLSVPAHGVQKLRDDIPVSAQVFQVRFIQFPPVIINVPDRGIRTFEEGNIVQIPIAVISKMMHAHFGCIYKMGALYLAIDLCRKKKHTSP